MTTSTAATSAATGTTATVTAGTASIPEALPVFLRRPEEPMRYGWGTRFGDWLAGRRDRLPRSAAGPDGAPPRVAASPWLQRLAAECENRILAERRVTEALLAVLARQAASVTGEGDHVRRQLAEAREQLSEQVRRGPLQGPMSTAERLSDAAEITQRRQTEHQQALAELAAAIDDLKVTATRIAAQTEAVRVEQRWHWALLETRVCHLGAYYNRRAGTYASALERRRDGVFYAAPVLELPVLRIPVDVRETTASDGSGSGVSNEETE